MTTLERVRAEIDTRFKEARIENTRFYYDVLDIIDKYAEKEPPENADLKEIFCMDCEYKEQEPCDDVVSRQAVLDAIRFGISNIRAFNDTTMIRFYEHENEALKKAIERVNELPPIRPQEQTGYCKGCKYFEYDSVAKVDGVPLIVAHEICNKWGDGCKTKEDGYCFLFEPQESEDKE